VTRVSVPLSRRAAQRLQAKRVQAKAAWLTLTEAEKRQLRALLRAAKRADDA
jgi:hypothetical protein